MYLSKNKKGVVGLETAKLFIVGLLILTVFGFALFLIVSNLNNSQAAQVTITVVNETGGSITDSIYRLVETANHGTSSTSITAARNGTAGGGTIDAANFTVTAIGEVTNASTVQWASVDFDYTFREPVTRDIAENITTGAQSLFSNAGTWFSLLSIVIIILIISIVVLAVNRFGGGREGGGRL